MEMIKAINAVAPLDSEWECPFTHDADEDEWPENYIPPPDTKNNAETLSKNLETDIGYNVNDAANGIWLPGNYQVRPGNEDYKKKWSEYSDGFKNKYAVRAIKMANNQFHDAHTDYNDNVRKTLQTIKATMIIRKNGKCPICPNENHDKTKPPYGLVGRLNFISQQHRQKLMAISDKSSRKLSMVKKGYNTSSRVFSYFGLEK